MNSKRLFAVVLAAGASTRFGATKQLADYRGEILVYRAVRLAEAVCAELSVLVIGSDWQRVHDASAPLEGFLVRNDAFATGMAPDHGALHRRCPDHRRSFRCGLHLDRR